MKENDPESKAHITLKNIRDYSPYQIKRVLAKATTITEIEDIIEGLLGINRIAQEQKNNLLG